jgi:hypothetical protein
MCHSGPAGVNDQFFLGEKLERAVSFGVNGVPEAAVNGRKHGDDRTNLMVVGCVIDLLANRKLRHRKLLLESSVRLYRDKSVDRSLTIQLPEFSGAVVVIMPQLSFPEVRFHGTAKSRRHLRTAAHRVRKSIVYENLPSPGS